MNDLALEFARRGPWSTGFEVDGGIVGNPDFVPRGEMERQFFECFPSALTVLETGSLECGRTQYLSRQAQSVICIEGRRDNLQRAAWVRRWLQLDNVNFFRADLEETLPRFRADAVYCVGCLYHMTQPWHFLGQLVGIAPCLYLWTHITNTPDEQHHGMDFQRMPEDARQPLAGMRDHALWGTEEAVLKMLSCAGYVGINIISEEQHRNGPAITVTARRAA